MMIITIEIVTIMTMMIDKIDYDNSYKDDKNRIVSYDNNGNDEQWQKR